MTTTADQRKRREQDFYDRGYAGDYNERPATRFYAAAESAYRHYDRLVREEIGSGSVLECGCGVGDYSLHLAELGVDVVGTDISPVAIEAGRRKAAERGLRERARFEVMDCEDLELPDDSIDVACGEGVLHHTDLSRTFPELARVMRPEGRGVFLEPLGHNPVINLYRRRTPEQRTEDEHPLRIADLELARESFGLVEATYFTLFGLGALPLRGRRSFQGVVSILDRLDRALFRAIPATRRYAWIVVLTLAEPR